MERAWGSSPLTRGKPAYRPTGQRSSQAHPRSRGENGLLASTRRLIKGSSPLTRGKPGLRVVCLPRPRLIPAHAGKTFRSRARLWIPRAHPRSRGENAVGLLLFPIGGGSSPLTRGKRSGHGRGSGSQGLIPAHAGKTLSAFSSSLSAAAHPRSRGENLTPAEWVTKLNGSSPLTRGKRWHFHGGHGSHRLIPAHAGKTPACSGYDPGVPAHPRSRGENRGDWVQNGHRPGSSPLTRGKLDTTDKPINQ